MAIVKSIIFLSVVFAASVGAIAQAAPKFEAVPKISYCELAAHPEVYDQKIVRVHVRYTFMFEVSMMFDTTCEVEAAWVELDPSYKDNTSQKEVTKFQQSMTATKPGKKGSDLFDLAVEPHTLSVVWTGKFYAGSRSRSFDPVKRRGGWGHFGGYAYKFTVLKIDKIK